MKKISLFIGLVALIVLGVGVSSCGETSKKTPVSELPMEKIEGRWRFHITGTWYGELIDYIDFSKNGTCTLSNGESASWKIEPLYNFSTYRDFVWYDKVKREVDEKKIKNYIKIKYDYKYEKPVVANNAFKGSMHKQGYANSSQDRYTETGHNYYEMRIIGSYIFLYSAKGSWVDNSEWSHSNRGDFNHDGKKSDAFYLGKD